MSRILVCERLEDRLVLASTFDVIDFTQGTNGDMDHDPPVGEIEWINGILNQNNSELFEGMSTLQRVYLDGVVDTVDNVHTLTFGHQAEKGDQHAYDFLTSWDQAVDAAALIAPGSLIDPHTDFNDALEPDSGLEEVFEPGPASPASFTSDVQSLHAAANTVDVDLPDFMGDPSIGGDVDARIAAYEAIFGNRTVRIYGDQAIVSASITFDGYTGTGGNQIANYSLTWTSDSDLVFIEFGGHLAQGNDFLADDVGYGAELGAGSISGAPYHIFLYDLDDGSLGSQDNQIQSNAVAPPPDFTIEKTGDTLSKVGDSVTYTFTVTHTGDDRSADLELVSFEDSVLGDLTDGELPAEGVVLSPGESVSFDVMYTIQSDDPDPLVNEVTAVYSLAGLPLVEFTRTDTHEVNLFQPDIIVNKTAIDAPSPLMEGDTVTYEIEIINNSSADSPDLIHDSIVDTKIGALDPSGFAQDVKDDNILQVGESWKAQVDYTVKEEDLPSFTNTVTAHFHPDGFPNDITDDDSVTLQVAPEPDFTIEKTGDTLSKVGDDVTYTFTITHTGPAGSPDLALVDLTDTVLGELDDGELPADGFVLSQGESVSFDVVYTIQSDDPDPLTNTVTAVYEISGRPELVDISRSDTHTVELFQPGIVVEKTAIAAPDPLLAGSTVTYEVKITNLSSSDSPDLIPDSIFDSKILDLDPSAFDETKDDDNILQVGEIWTGKFDYLVQMDDFPSLTNTVTVHFHPDGFPNDITDDDSVTLQVALPVEEGRMTGGGSIFLEAGATPNDEGLRVTHGFQLHCGTGGGSIEDVNNRLEINWGKPNNHFHLQNLTSVVCADTGIVQAPPDAPIDTLDATGVGRFSGRLPDGTRLNNVAASIVLTLTDGGMDKGEPGLEDTAQFLIKVDTDDNDVPDTVVLDTNKPLMLQSSGHANGNHQSHEEIPPLQSTEVTAIQQDIEKTFSQLNNPKLNEGRIDTLTAELLQQFDQLEAALDGDALVADSIGGGGGVLSDQQLQTHVQAALAFWSETGVDTQTLGSLNQLQVRVWQLPGNLLGLASESTGTIWIDRDAAGHGWSVGTAPGRMDLDTVLEHEIGHLLGFEHEADYGVMAGVLSTGAADVHGDPVDRTGFVTLFSGLTDFGPADDADDADDRQDTAESPLDTAFVGWKIEKEDKGDDFILRREGRNRVSGASSLASEDVDRLFAEGIEHLLYDLPWDSRA